MKAGSPQPLLIEVYERRTGKGAWADDARVGCCSFPSSLTSAAAFARVRDFLDHWQEAEEVEDLRLRLTKAFVDMGAAVGTSYRSVTVLKKITPGYVRTFPTGVPVVTGGFTEGTIEVSEAGMDRAETGMDGIIRLDLKRRFVEFGAVERLCKEQDMARLFPEYECAEGSADMLGFGFDEVDEVRKRWFAGRSGHTAYVIDGIAYGVID
jgi:hypothetical protein